MLAVPCFSQSNYGELHLKVTDPSGLGVRTLIQIVSKANQYRTAQTTNDQGSLRLPRLPYGIYRLDINYPGFAPVSESVEIRSSLPTDLAIQLKLPAVNQSIDVNAANTLIDPDQPRSVSEVGTDLIQNRVGSVPGRSVQDLVNMQPGWLYEGNAVLHPRGSEYQTQFVVDGIPLTDNRSPSFGPEIEADDVQSMSIYTAGIPAEYGRKMGGVVEVNTLQDPTPGLHGQFVLSGGSFDSAGAFGQAQYVWGKNAFGISASGSMTGHYLNPVVPQNFSNTGTLGDFSSRYERDFTPSDRLSFLIRHEIARYDIPNEMVQQAAGQRQTADNIETMGIASYQHIFSSQVVADIRGMVRDNSNDFNSNANSTPIEVFQHNWFREGYFKGAVTVDHGRHEWKFGVESDNTFLHENFRYLITDPTQFPPDTPLIFIFPVPAQPNAGSRPDLEQSAFVQDLIRLGNWTISAGLRWDHYQVLVNRQAVGPRFSSRAIFRPLISFCISPTTVYSKRRRLKISCFQVPWTSNPSIQGISCACRLSPRKEIITKQGSRNPSPAGFGSTLTISGAWWTTLPTTTRSSTLQLVFQFLFANPLSTERRQGFRSLIGGGFRDFSAIPTMWATPGSR